MKCFDIHNIIYLFFILISHLRNGVNSSADLVCQNESKCNCLCDVNSGTCDFNCCCDADCTSEEIEFFTFPCGEETNAKKTNDKRAQVKIAKCDEKKSKSNIKTSDFDLKRLSDFVEVSIRFGCRHKNHIPRQQRTLLFASQLILLINSYIGFLIDSG